ncbi:MAG: META domain-containing protein [Alphaproteobacteria bacterium]|nr:META domain-containing protein [Alphaproteobacteria bacterium SS10]
MRALLFLALITVIAAFGNAAPAVAQEGNLPNLLGETWVRSFDLAPANLAVPDGLTQTIAFNPDGTMGGNTGCNGFGGTVALEKGLFKPGPTRMSRRACLNTVMAAEQDYMTRIGAARQWWVRQNELHLADGQGRPLLRFHRQ